MLKRTPHEQVTLALDLMGSDGSPQVELKGAALALKKEKTLRFILVGDKVRIMPILDTLPKLKEASEVIHTDMSITNHDRPSTAIRSGKESSMGVALRVTQEGRADGTVSAGNTGALMALASYVLKTLPGIDRPAIAGIFPSKRANNVVIDLGANIDCKANNLCEFAMMGSAFARTVLGITNPRVGLLNIGAEEMKGTDVLKQAATKLRHGEYAVNYYGFVEGNDIAQGTVDVIVSDGFTGNIALKTTEGTVKMYTFFLRDAVRSSLLAKIGFLFIKPALMRVFKKLDPRLYNSAFFLGLNGLVVKSHGGTDEVGFANAILNARRAVVQRTNVILNDMIAKSGAGETADTSHAPRASNVISLEEGLS